MKIVILVLNRTRDKNEDNMTRKGFFYDEATEARCIVRVRIGCYDDMNPSKEEWKLCEGQ